MDTRLGQTTAGVGDVGHHLPGGGSAVPTPTPPDRTSASSRPPHWAVTAVASLIIGGLLVGAAWATTDHGDGVAAVLVGLVVIVVAGYAMVIGNRRGQRRQDEVLAAIDTAVETVLGVANQAEWRGFAAGMRENLADDSTDGTVGPIPRATTGGNGRRRPRADS